MNISENNLLVNRKKKTKKKQFVFWRLVDDLS